MRPVGCPRCGRAPLAAPPPAAGQKRRSCGGGNSAALEKNHGPLAQKPFLHRKHDTIYKKRCLISFSSLERGVYFNTSFLNCHELDL